MSKKVFKIPVTWESFGVVEIEAETLDEAIAIFDETQDRIPLPYDSEYVDSSFRREDEETCSLNNMNF
jgi:hypothetical protein